MTTTFQWAPVSAAAIAAGYAAKRGDTFTGPVAIHTTATPGWNDAGGDLFVAGTINGGNLSTGIPAGFAKTRGLCIENGMDSIPGDVEDVHGALILGSLQSKAVGAHGHAFGAEIQGQTYNVAGITPGVIIGVNGLAVHMSDGTVSAGNYVAGVVGTAQFGNSTTPAITSTVDLAAGVIGNDLTFFTPGHTITKAVSIYAKAQTNGAFRAGVYSEGDMVTASGTSLGIGLGFVAPTTAAQVNGAITLGTGAASNTGTGDIVGINKLVIGSKDANHAGQRIYVVANAMYLQGGDAGHNLTLPGGTILLKLTAGGSVVTNAAALATNATDGFTYLPSSAGTPTGTPTTQTGTVPVQLDTTNSKLYAYIGGAWKSILLA